MSERNTVRTILQKTVSLCRFGDGELNILMNGRIGFQQFDENLRDRLREILRSTPQNCLIGLPPQINSVKGMIWRTKFFWVNSLDDTREKWIREMCFDAHPNYVYASTATTRWYIEYRSRKRAIESFRLLRSIWEGRKLLIVEGEGTRMGVGNPVLNNAASVRRIIAPAKDAFTHYAKILHSVLSNAGCCDLIIAALGPTATVLCYDCAQRGLWALDVGHLDLEYEWFIRGTHQKSKIPGKYVNEVDGGECFDALPVDLENRYKSEIIEVICDE